MYSLESIPNEISTEILSYLPVQSIACLSGLSRRMYSLSTPVLYKSITIESNRIPRRSSLQMIIGSLLSPAGETLATYVRALDIKWNRDNTNLSRPLPREILLFKAAADSRGITRPIITPTAQFLLLLHLVHRLHYLKVAPANLSADALAEIIVSFDTTDLSQPSQAPACFHFLREFHSPIHLPTKALLVILHLPYIRTVDFKLINDKSIDIPTIAALAHTSSVTDLRLQSSHSPAATLMHIFRIPTSLTSFSFRVRYGYFPAPAPSLEELLHPHRLTLKHQGAQLREDVQPSKIGVFQLGAFCEWPALQSVTISISALLGCWAEGGGRRLADVLPRGLRVLHIQRNRIWTLEQEREALVQLLQDETAVPGLRKLVVNHGTGGQGCTGMVDACEAAGVTLLDNGEWRVSWIGRTPLPALGLGAENLDNLSLGLWPPSDEQGGR